MQKKVYTRSQLIQLASDARGAQSLESTETAQKLIERQIGRRASVSACDSLGMQAYEVQIGGEPGQKLTDDFWSNVTTSATQNTYDDLVQPETFNANFQTAFDDAQLDLPCNAKVDRWLNAGPNPIFSKDGRDSVAAPISRTSNTPVNNPTEYKDDVASNVSTKSAIRSKLLDKTAKVKQTLRNLTNNNNNNNN